jgi:hypothetical protein
MLNADYKLLKDTMKTDFDSFLSTIPRHERTSTNLVAVLSGKLSAKSLACFPQYSNLAVKLLVPMPLRHMLVSSKIHPIGKRQWSQALFENIRRE